VDELQVQEAQETMCFLPAKDKLLYGLSYVLYEVKALYQHGCLHQQNDPGTHGDDDTHMDADLSFATTLLP
jgi:hypothetical protein